MIHKFDTDVNFWELYPQYKVIEPFKSFYPKDRTKGKIYSSTVMWAIVFLHHPESPLANTTEEDRRKIIENEVVGDNRFKWDEYKELEEKFAELELNSSQRSLKLISKKIQEREKLIDDTEYTLDNAKDLDAVILNTEKIYKLRKFLEDEASKKSNEGETKGGAEESASEKGLI